MIIASVGRLFCVKQSLGRLTSRSFAGKPPGMDPLHVLQQECIARNLCDADGLRVAGVDWRISIAISAEEPNRAPNLRTVGVERVSSAGIDFILKRGTPISDTIGRGTEVSFIHTSGRLLPGEFAEQWRGEGLCMALPLDDVLDQIPHFTITSIVGSRRLADKMKSGEDQRSAARQRSAVSNRSHVVEVMQETRIQLENGDISMEELNQSMRAFRLQPERIECMLAGVDSSVMWDRWEWIRDPDCPEGLLAWMDAKQLVPH